MATALASSNWLSASSLASPSAAEYRVLGLRYRQQNRWSEAIAALQKSVELEPKNLAGRVTLGWTFHLAKQDRAAAKTLQQAIQQDPLNVPALNALGIVYLVNDDLAASVLTHGWAAYLEPDNEIAHYNLSLAFQRLKYYDRAIAAAKKAAMLEPSNPHPLVALAIAFLEKGDRANAQKAYQEAINLDARYRNSEFLNHLDEAGFSADQIAMAKSVLNLF